MGTQIRLVLYDSDKEKADSVSVLAFQRIDELNTILSDYLVNSELNLLCVKKPGTYEVSDDLYRVLKKADSVSKLTEGAFDVTAGPLIGLWRKARMTKKMPGQTELSIARERVGYNLLQLTAPNKVRLNVEGMRLDLGGIGKGFAADEVIGILEMNGIFSGLIDMGGDIRVSGPPPEREYWILGFSYFDRQGKECFQKIKLKDGAVATSGSLYQFVEINGIKFSHIINPKSGLALKDGIQVTTISRYAAEADAFASAFSVIGLDPSILRDADYQHLEVFMTNQSTTGYEQWESSGFKQFLMPE
ncbi:FAD:protein FMN transferase [Maribacter polysiphoniae]|uniref:FAD:protein FMN transferase n=1 Tax=Maribacter polysiphoniae TaxID=429344 RepID=A0A316E8P1_9FLAO|nr:FAD:protein FMN transferase [Maribacter polysiphoniae]MBD1262339.1 FAD:protein FMN transferase [Maribacter polysiphoniae]PWK26038.1 thiamine biosynthesis lipoprotein [Maribacter polysiphoniae]